jgi:hypothetical protein
MITQSSREFPAVHCYSAALRETILLPDSVLPNLTMIVHFAENPRCHSDGSPGDLKNLRFGRERYSADVRGRPQILQSLGEW